MFAGAITDDSWAKKKEKRIELPEQFKPKTHMQNVVKQVFHIYSKTSYLIISLPKGSLL